MSAENHFNTLLLLTAETFKKQYSAYQKEVLIAQLEQIREESDKLISSLQTVATEAEIHEIVKQMR